VIKWAREDNEARTRHRLLCLPATGHGLRTTDY